MAGIEPRFYVEERAVNAEQLITPETILPQGATNALLVGRVWSKAADGPCPVLISSSSPVRVLDLSSLAPTISQLLEIDGLVEALGDRTRFADLGSLEEFLDGT